jgi:hypothetical protein
LDSQSHWINQQGSGSPTAEARLKAALLTAGLESVASRLKVAGQKVILIEPALRFDDAGGGAVLADRCSTWSLALSRCPVETAVESASPGQALALDSVAQAAYRSGVTFLSVVDYQSPDGFCSPYVTGTPLYEDSGQVSTAFRGLLAPLFRQVIGKAQ